MIDFFYVHHPLSVLIEEFSEKFLTKRLPNSKESQSNMNGSVEIKTMEIFYGKIFEKVKVISKQEISSSDKINVIF